MDYDKMIELMEYDEDHVTYVLNTPETPVPSDAEQSPTSSRSPTTDVTDESTTEQEETTPQEHTPRNSPPPLPPRLPVDLLQRLNITMQLDLPEVLLNPNPWSEEEETTHRTIWYTTERERNHDGVEGRR